MRHVNCPRSNKVFTTTYSWYLIKKLFSPGKGTHYNAGIPTLRIQLSDLSKHRLIPKDTLFKFQQTEINYTLFSMDGSHVLEIRLIPFSSEVKLHTQVYVKNRGLIGTY